MEPSGLLIFSIIKYAGYFLFFILFNNKENKTNPFLAAFIRLAIGLIIGFAIMYFVEVSRGRLLDLYFSVTLIARILIWYSVLKFLYRKIEGKRLFWGVVFGVALSYMLDLPVFIGLFFITGGIC